MSTLKGPGLRMRLRRPKQVQQKIQKNLAPLLQNNKKQVAQNIYYQSHHTHKSPLTRDLGKEPVHQRLGVKQMRLKRVVPLGTNTASVLPKKKMLRRLYKPQSPSRNLRNNKLRRVNLAQTRLERIRAHLNRNHHSIKLRRPTGPGGGLPPATNLTVQVKNPEFAFDFDSAGAGYKGRFKMMLNPEIQAEIREIQKENGRGEITIHPSTRITPVTTGVPITHRFALY